MFGLHLCMVYVHHMCAWCHQDQNVVSDLPDLEFQVTWVLGIQPEFSEEQQELSAADFLQLQNLGCYTGNSLP